MTEAKTHAATGQVWAARAASAERAVCARHLRPLWGLPGTLLGVSGWPGTTFELLYGPWNYWWQAHLLDCLVDAYVRSPDSERLSRIERTLNGIRIRAFRSWLNDYYDDMAWLALAVQRAEKYAGVSRPAALPALTEDIRAGWTDLSGGGVWWRKREKYHDDFKNVPTNGPAAILFARLSEPTGFTGFDDPAGAHEASAERANRTRARDTVNWIEQHLIDADTGLVYDGLHVNEDGSISGVEKVIYTYCQGTFLAACVELAVLESVDGDEIGGIGEGSDGGGPGSVWADRAVRTIQAVATLLTDHDDEAGPTLRGHGGGDPGLFAGILARYLGLAARKLPGIGSAYAKAGQLAADLVYTSAEAAWRNRTEASNGPIFGPDWTKRALLPMPDIVPERDLSVQLGGWMLMEAAADLERAGIRPRS